LDDPRALTILNAEHGSLLAARSLVYNETFTRVGTFMTFLSATFVALGLLSNATGFSRDFLVIAAMGFAVNLIVGLATLGRVIDASAEEMRYVAGMNRLRHAYHEIVPGLDRYFLSSKHDDAVGVLRLYGVDIGEAAPGPIATLIGGLKTLPALMIEMCSIVMGVLTGIVLLLITDSPIVASVGGLVALALTFVVFSWRLVVSATAFLESLRPEFPTPSGPVNNM
jgi:hypothetical protein